MHKVRRLFVFPISKQNKNLGFSHVESGNQDTSRFVLKNRLVGWFLNVTRLVSYRGRAPRQSV